MITFDIAAKAGSDISHRQIFSSGDTNDASTQTQHIHIVVLDALRLGFVSDGPALVADLTRVSFFGSTGISTLITAHELADAHCKDFHVVAPHRAVKRPLQVTGVADVLALYDSIDEVLSALKPVPSE